MSRMDSAAAGAQLRSNASLGRRAGLVDISVPDDMGNVSSSA